MKYSLLITLIISIFLVNPDCLGQEPTPKEPSLPVVQEEVFKVVEEMPRFPGCEFIDGTHREKSECAEEKNVRIHL